MHWRSYKNDETLKGFKTRAALHARKYDISNIIPVYERLYERFLGAPTTYC